MTVESLNKQQTKASEKAPMTVQNDVQKEIQKQVMQDASGVSATSSAKQLLQMLATAQPGQSIQQTAQSQISKGKGHLDIKV